VTVVIPVCNEAKNIGRLVEEARQHAGDVIPADDNSVDAAGQTARGAGTVVTKHTQRKGTLRPSEQV